MRCSTPTPTSSQARGEPCDVPQADHRASSRSERHFQGAVPLLRTSDQRVRACSLATLTDSSSSSPRRTALNAAHDGDQRRTQGADPALPLRRALAGGHHRLAAPRPPLHRRAGAGRAFVGRISDLRSQSGAERSPLPYLVGPASGTRPSDIRGPKTRPVKGAVTACETVGMELQQGMQCAWLPGDGAKHSQRALGL